ncbi:hypothetical protein [Chitinimonas sp. BJB300]|uniref:hypothetical protein n=1 Tax=Chitinimonas sp. BJB300 TaxID=1559339 RepID=UPI000C0E6DB4|nr:hypothetical protein [Chitinimonas sp. BJB300]PHV13376.1 hypothetical protein CSQ89_01045 [Chitinimonas sp. BJB300]TSJ85293.1 hypothetical protein FG002_017930 [Chitinimonas sp. BJB300]
MADYQAANKAVFECDARMEKIAQAIASKKPVPNNLIKETEQVLTWALEWQEEANAAIKTELKPLSKLGDSGNKLIELIPLMSKAGDKPRQTSTKHETSLESGIDPAM